MVDDALSRAEAQIRVGLTALRTVQAFGARGLPDHLQELDTADFRTAALGAFVELGELVNEAQWKPWRQYSEPTAEDRVRVLKEFADVLHFIAWMSRNLSERFDLSTLDFASAFIDVHEENVARFAGRVRGHEPPVPIGIRARVVESVAPDGAGVVYALPPEVYPTKEERRPDDC